MVVKSPLALVLIPFYCVVVVNFVSAKTVPPSQIEPLSDLYSIASTYPAANNVVNYNASPNPQYSTSNFNSFNEQTAQRIPQLPGNYQNMDYQPKPFQQQQKSLEELVTGNSPTVKPNDYSNELKNTLVSMKDNLGFMADTQRLLLNSFKVQQHQYNNIEEKLQLNESPLQRSAAYGGQQNYGPQQPQYQSISPPPLPPLPYAQPTHQEHKVHHKKPASVKKVLGKLFKKNRKGKNRGLALFQRRSESERLQRHAAMTLTYIRNGVVNALWTALVVACVKLAPILLFGFKLMFKSVLPLTGLALFGTNRGLFPQYLKKDDTDNDIRLDDDDDDDDDDEEDEDEDELEEIDGKDVSEEKDENSSGRYR